MKIYAHALLCTLSLLLVACGADSGTAAEPEALPGKAAPDTVSLELFDAQGRPLLTPAARVPVRSEARTRLGLYATPEQLAWQEIVAGPVTVVLDIDQLGLGGAALLAQHVRGWRGASEMGLAWYVRGGADEEAANLVNQLADDGVAPVFLVR